MDIAHEVNIGIHQTYRGFNEPLFDSETTRLGLAKVNYPILLGNILKSMASPRDHRLCSEKPRLQCQPSGAPFDTPYNYSIDGAAARLHWENMSSLRQRAKY